MYIQMLSMSNTLCCQQAGPSGEEEEDSEEEQAEGEEQEERKRYQLRERRPIQPNLYQPSFGGQASRQAWFDGRHHLAELLVVCCLAVLSVKLLVVRPFETHVLVVMCDHGVGEWGPFEHSSLERVSISHPFSVGTPDQSHRQEM